MYHYAWQVAHGIGVVGETGRGRIEKDNAFNDVDAITITFSKSLASCGGAIVGDKCLTEFMKINSRPFVFTASNTPSSVAAASKALDVLQRNPQMVEELHDKKTFFEKELNKRVELTNSNDSGILTIRMGDDFRVLQAWKLLWNQGVYCNPVLSPAVPKSEGLLRFSIMRTHSYELLSKAAKLINNDTFFKLRP